MIACLHSDNKKEFVIAADLLAVILQNIDFDNEVDGQMIDCTGGESTT